MTALTTLPATPWWMDCLGVAIAIGLLCVVALAVDLVRGALDD